MAKPLYHHTGSLIRFILRRDRIRIPIWLLSLAFITVAVALSFSNLYASEQERQAIAETMRNPAMIAMVGPGYGLDDYTYGAMMAHQMLLFTALAVGLMSILLTARHTRADEEDGRIELIRSLPVGRLSHLNATMITLIGTNIVLALMIGFGLGALGMDSIDLEGSLLYGAALGAIGIFFAAVTAVFVQLSENVRGAIGLSIALLLISYLVRAIGDVSHETWSWFSPLGWIVGTEAYVNNYWWPVLLTVGISLLMMIFAYYLNAIRDLGSGFIPAKPGKRHASSFLLSPLGLSFRLQRTGIIAWAIGMLILGASYGSVFGDLDSFFKDNELMAELISVAEGFTLTDQFVTMLMSVMAMICTVPALMAMLKIIGEEKKNRTEHILSRAVSRIRLLGSSFFVSFVVCIVMMIMAAIGLWSAAEASMADGLALDMILGSAMVYLPAMWIMIGIAVFLIGIVPRWSQLIWVYLVYSFVVVYLGQLLQFPEWMSRLSPFGYVPQIPVEEMNWIKVIILSIIAMALTVAGFVGYNKRDIQG